MAGQDLARVGSKLRSLLREEAEARADRECQEWLDKVTVPDVMRRPNTDAAAQQALLDWGDKISVRAGVIPVLEGNWDPAKHPRTEVPPNPGWWARTDGEAGSASAERSPSFLDAVVRRNQTMADLTGVVTPGMIRSSRLATELQSAVRLPGKVARAAAAGLGTGGKAVVNASATAIRSVATLGLNTRQLVHPAGWFSDAQREFVAGPRKGQTEKITGADVDQHRKQAEEVWGKYIPGSLLSEPRFIPGTERKSVPLIIHKLGVPYEAGWIDEKGVHYYPVPREIAL